MKLFHLSDLHLGRRLSETSLIEDQKFILQTIINKVREEKPDAVLIAGDVYDKSVPTDEATALCDWMLSELHKLTRVFVSSGNHDSADKVAYGSKIFEEAGVYVSPKYDGNIVPMALEDSYGKVNIYMLPFVKPFEVRKYYPDEDTDSYNSAIQTAIKHLTLNTEERNIILVHQFITGAETSDSETQSVGGLDNIDASVFQDFDYVALGHIHKPQWIIENKVRYCGTPLKYSFSEVNNENSITVIELKEKGNISFSFIPLIPKRNLVEYRGKFDDIMKNSNRDDYVKIVLTDENPVTDVFARLKENYPFLMEFKYDNTQSRERDKITGVADIEKKSNFELFSDLFSETNERELTDEEKDYVKDVFKRVWGEEE